jgi:hypothetical protein
MPLCDAAIWKQWNSITDLLDANESTGVFVAVGRVGCVLSSQVAAFVSLANATGRWNYCGRIADASVDNLPERERALAVRGAATDREGGTPHPSKRL